MNTIIIYLITCIEGWKIQIIYEVLEYIIYEYIRSQESVTCFKRMFYFQFLSEQLATMPL